MKCASANTLLLQITNAINDSQHIVASGASNSTQSYIAKYLVVFISGIYEQAIEEIIWEYATQFNSAELENYISNQVDQTFRNPDMSKIIELVKKFSTTWSNTLKSLDPKHRNALNSIVNHKNLIAHGSQSTITISDVVAYHNDARVVIDKIDSLFL